MAIYGYHEHPDVLVFEANVVDSQPGRVALDRSLLHPGGGGQVSDRAKMTFRDGNACIVNVVHEGGRYWHILDRPITITGESRIEIDAAHRLRVAQLHTITHVLNALVFQRFDGALVTGAQINADGTARMDFDLGIDRQACGGTHLTNTSESLPVRITKVENKGRRNRRVKLAIDSK